MIDFSSYPVKSQSDFQEIDNFLKRNRSFKIILKIIEIIWLNLLLKICILSPKIYILFINRSNKD